MPEEASVPFIDPLPMDTNFRIMKNICKSGEFADLHKSEVSDLPRLAMGEGDHNGIWVKQLTQV